MRRLFLFTSVILVLWLAACQPGTRLVLNEENNGQTINLTAGDEFKLELPGNITTGYNWTIDALDESALQLVSEDYEESRSDLLGAGGTSVFTFKALQAGQTSLKLIYSRPFEKGVPPEKTFEITIAVQ